MLEPIHALPRPHAAYVFGDLRLDTRQCALWRGTVHLPLPRLSYELLLALLESAPDVVPYDALADRVWRGRWVSPETLAQRVLLLRRALGDAADHPRYVRVVRGLGCQMALPVARPSLAAGETVTASPGRPRAGAVHAARRRDDTLDLSLPAQPSLVVLPFDTDSDEHHRTFARGLTHDLMTRVARTRSFFVTARGTAFRFAPGAIDVRDVPRLLGVRYVVQGHVQFEGQRLRINVSLADAVQDRELWAECFHRTLDGIFDAQDEITQRVVGSLSVQVDAAEQRRALLETPANLDAWTAYHRGCWHMYRFTAHDYAQAQHYFELSAAMDANSPRTLAGLSFVHWQRAFLDLAHEHDRERTVAAAFDLAQRAVALNPMDPQGHWALGRAHLLRGELEAALLELDAATALNPSFAVGQYSLGFALMHAGDTAHSIERADRARRLSPLDPMKFAMIGVRGFSLALDGDYAEAARLMTLSVQQPNAHHHIVAMAAVCDALAGHRDVARRHLQRLRVARPGYAAPEFLRAFPLQRGAHRALVESAFARMARA